MFYKFINENTIRKAPIPLNIDGKDVFTNSENIHNQQGYYAIKTTDCPQNEKSYRPIYELKDNLIIQKWEEVEVEGDEATIKDYHEALAKLGVDVDE